MLHLRRRGSLAGISRDESLSAAASRYTLTHCSRHHQVSAEKGCSCFHVLATPRNLETPPCDAVADSNHQAKEGLAPARFRADFLSFNPIMTLLVSPSATAVESGAASVWRLAACMQQALLPSSALVAAAAAAAAAARKAGAARERERRCSERVCSVAGRLCWETREGKQRGRKAAFTSSPPHPVYSSQAVLLSASLPCFPRVVNFIRLRTREREGARW